MTGICKHIIQAVNRILSQKRQNEMHYTLHITHVQTCANPSSSKQFHTSSRKAASAPPAVSASRIQDVSEEKERVKGMGTEDSRCFLFHAGTDLCVYMSMCMCKPMYVCACAFLDACIFVSVY